MTLIHNAAAALALAAALPALSEVALADGTATVTIRNHAFEPNVVVVKAGEKIKLTVVNAQNEAAEFESHELNREKVVPPGSSVVVYIGPLEPGAYGFFDDFHAATKGRIVAK